MVEIIKKLIDLQTDFINYFFMLEVEFEAGQMVPIGKIVVAFVYTVVTIYLILDALGILEKGAEE